MARVCSLQDLAPFRSYPPILLPSRPGIPPIRSFRLRLGQPDSFRSVCSGGDLRRLHRVGQVSKAPPDLALRRRSDGEGARWSRLQIWVERAQLHRRGLPRPALGRRARSLSWWRIRGQGFQEEPSQG